MSKKLSLLEEAKIVLEQCHKASELANEAKEAASVAALDLGALITRIRFEMPGEEEQQK